MAGALGIVLGLGGGIFLVPFLTLALGFPRKSAAAISLAINQSGAVRTKTIALLTAEEMDLAAKKSVGYRPPGQ